MWYPLQCYTQAGVLRNVFLILASLTCQLTEWKKKKRKERKRMVKALSARIFRIHTSLLLCKQRKISTNWEWSLDLKSNLPAVVQDLYFRGLQRVFLQQRVVRCIIWSLILDYRFWCLQQVLQIKLPNTFFVSALKIDTYKCFLIWCPCVKILLC